MAEQDLPAEGLLNPDTLAAYLATRLPIEGLAALYLIIEDNPDSLVVALQDRIRALGSKTETTGLQYGQASEFINHELIGKVIAERGRRQEAADRDGGEICKKS
jgi:hypothetical protein